DQLAARERPLLERNGKVVVVARDARAGRDVTIGVYAADERVEVLDLLPRERAARLAGSAAERLRAVERGEPVAHVLRRRAIGGKRLVGRDDVDMPAEPARPPRISREQRC